VRQRLDRCHHLPRTLAIAPRQPHGVADAQVLPLRVDGVRIVDVRADGAFQQGVAVEAAAVLPDLR